MPVLCITYTWRYQVAVQRKVSMKWKSSRILKLIETSTVQCRRSHRCHCDTVSQITTIWNGPMADLYYEQQKALGHVVEGMRLRFQIRSQICCLVNVFEAWGREAMVLPPSLVDSSESHQNTLHCATRPTQTKTHETNHHNGQQMLQLSVCQKHTSPSGERHQIYILYIYILYILY